jgi:hypothetical protein
MSEHSGAPNIHLLDGRRILETLARLRDRIGERFPESGLARVSADVLVVGKETATLTAEVRRPNWPIRIGVGVAIAAMALILVAILRTLHIPTTLDGTDLVQATDAALNELVLLGAAIFFLVSLEARIKRKKTLAALHRLRSLAHIVDMHQLTKDPERLDAERVSTKSSPMQSLDAAQLGRYLDYCSELLSLISKIAALHVQHFNDPVVLAAVNEIETLSTGLSSKIWQKITMLDLVRTKLPPASA